MGAGALSGRQPVKEQVWVGKERKSVIETTRSSPISHFSKMNIMLNISTESYIEYVLFQKELTALFE